MAGLSHDFLMLARKEYPFSGYMSLINDPRAIQLHDDLIRYMHDTLEWVPSYNPAKGEPHQGLCMWGPTIIHIDGAALAAKVFASWATLFSNGPVVLRLTGCWTQIEGDPQSEGHYERLLFDRDETVSKLRRITSYAEQVLKTNGDLYILHMGV